MARRPNGAAIKSLREAIGITQKTLAERTGISQSAMSQVESGDSGLRPDNLRRVADVLGVPLDAITSVIPEPAAVP